MCLLPALAAVAVHPARADKIDEYVTAQLRSQHIPGLSLAILKGGKPIKLKGYGVANLELDAPATPQSVYKIGSLSKQFIAAGLMVLAREGKVGLDNSIREYLKDAPETWQTITVRHLLTHTGGLAREAPGFEPLKLQSDAELIQTAYSTPLSFSPGEKFEYSNLGYYVLAEIIHRASQNPWPQYLQERLFAPLGMSATRTTTNEELVPHRADGHEWIDGKYRNGNILIGVRPSGAFLSNIQDLAKWDLALYSDQLLSQAQREAMWKRVKLNDGSERPYGFGWYLENVGKHRLVRHAGTIAGFRSEMARFVDDGLTVIVLTNSGVSVPERIAIKVASFYIPDLFPDRRAVQLPADVLDAYTGQYQLGGGRSLNIARSDRKLQITMSQGTMRMELGSLTPESSTRFFNEDDPRSTYVFSTDDRGQPQFWVENEEGKPGPKASKSDLRK
ncbi:MAG TPA: serine hydrolase [Bryobacteraceae bacterium]|nr:serine hydrolase [Bryobacteraceae bacterium]